MSDNIIVSSRDLKFESISDFKESLRYGAEIEFVWKNVSYGVVRFGTENKITIYQAHCPDTEVVCETADEARAFMVGEDRLRDVITQVEVVARTI